MSNPAEFAGSVAVVFKADEILGLLYRQGEMSVAEIANGVGEPRPSVYRLLGTLERMGFVESRHDSRFQLGLRLFSAGRSIASGLPIIAAAKPALDHLFELTEETIFLMVRRGPRAICLDRREGSRVRSMALDVGGTLPLHFGAAPLVLLAYAGEEAIEEYLRGGGLEPGAESASVSPEELEAQVRAVRERGYAISDEDGIPGMAAVAAPIRDASGTVTAALAVSGARVSILEPDPEALAKLVREAADSVLDPAPLPPTS